MKHIHVVEPYHSVAMQYLSEPLKDLAQLYGVTTSEEINPQADLNIHLPWHSLVGKERGTSKHIIAYTHCNRGAEGQLLDACERADIITAMSYEGRRELVELGVDPKKIWVIYAGANQFRYKKRVLAVVGYPQPNHRKRESLLFDLAWQYDLSRYQILLTGSGWEETVQALTSLGVSVQAFNADTYEGINEIYHRVDALLVTGYVEGGPLPLLEAMASGCKVFSPRFGYAADLLDESDLYETPDDLMQKLNAYFEPLVHNHILARAWTWQDYAREYALLIGRLLGESIDIQPEYGMSRYAQLLDIIDEVKPQRIVEIGTWKGDTALRMIQQAAKYRPIEKVFYQGFDLFEKQTPADFRDELSKAGWIQAIVYRRLNATGAGVELVGGYTKDTLPQYLNSDADLFFIDGGHSEETIRNDGDLVYSMKGVAVAIFDDYYHTGKPEGMGCNKFIDNLDQNKFEVTHLPVRTLASDGREIGMVKVRKNNANVPLQMYSETYTYTVSPDQ